MKIARLDRTLIRVSPKTTYLFLELETETGQRGLGDASMSHDDSGTAGEAVRLFEAFLEGMSLDRIGELIESMRAELGAYPPLALAAAASGLEQALWDLRGQQLGLPIHALLGGIRRERVPLYANINRGLLDRSPESFARRAGEAVAAGFGTVKIAPFDDVEPDRLNEPGVRAAIDRGVERIMAVRAAIGEKTRLRVDCHGRFELEESVALTRRLAPARLDWFEEPIRVSPQNVKHADPEAELTEVIDISVALAPRIDLPLSGGEYLYGIRQFERFMGSGSYRFVMPDVKYCGGVWEMQRIATLADARGVAFTPHNPGSPVASLHSVHVCAAAPSMDLLEFQWMELPWRAEMVEPIELVSEGQAIVPSAPGLGARLNREVVERYRVELE
jgi:galactonate dehydratase